MVYQNLLSLPWTLDFVWTLCEITYFHQLLTKLIFQLDYSLAAFLFAIEHFFFNGQGLEGSGKCGLGKELHDKASSQSGELCLMNCHWQARGQSHYPTERW